MHKRKMSIQAVALVLANMTVLFMTSGSAMARQTTPPSIAGDNAAASISRQTGERSDSRIGNNLDTGTGAFIQENQIVTIQGGRSLDFNLYYNSILSKARGPMGFGWSHNYEASLEGNPQGTMTVHWDRSRKNSFRFASADSSFHGDDEAVRYDDLIRNANGTWQLTRQDGTVYEFEANGDLRAIRNKVGQRLEMQRTFTVLTSIREPIASRTIYLNYTSDGRGLLREIRDELERHYYFAYDDAGRPTAVFDPTKVDGAHGQTAFQETIPDNNPQGLTYNINVSPTFNPIGLVHVNLGRITHARPSDLTVTLISPSGRQATLFNRTAVSGPTLELDNTLLENFTGENPAGIWRLVIVDSQAGETGRLTDFQMVFTQPTNAIRYTYASPISPMTASANASSDPGNLISYRGRLGERINFTVRGNALGGGVYGTGVYTDDSVLASAAVHARVLRTGEVGIVTVTILPGQNGGYAGSTQNGVTSAPRSSPWPGSYTISRFVPEVTSVVGSKLTRAVAQDGAPLFANIYDAEGRVASQAGGLVNGKIATVSYQDRPDGGVQTVYRNRSGNDTVFVHDASYRVTRITDPLGNATTFQYNAAGDRTLFIDPLQRETSFTYDVNGNLDSVKDPAGTTTRFNYDSYNNLTLIEDAAGRRSEFKYDGQNNLIEVRDAAGNVDKKTYNGNSQLIGSLLQDGAGLDYAYSSGMPTSAGFIGGTFSDCSSPCRGVTSYDNAGRLIRMADPQGYVTQMEYDLRDNLVAQKDSLGKVTTSDYDGRNRVIRKIDRNGNVTNYSYDENNNLVRQTDSLNQTTLYEYDAEDRMVRVIDPSGNIRTIDYDAAGRIAAKTDGLQNSIRYEYDAAGNEVTAYDARGLKVKTTTYDSRDHPTSVRDGFGNTYTSAYDTLGRQTSFKDPLNRTTSFSYDVLDRIVQVRDPMNRLFTQEYLQDDVISKISAPRNVFTVFRYDPANRIREVETSGGQLNTYRYNGSDSVTRETSLSGKIANYSYDSNGRLSSVSRTGAGFILPNVLYTYDDNGNLDRVRSAAASTTSGIKRDYDKLNRLSTFTDQAGNRIGYSYDKAGNLSVLAYPDGKSVTYEYDAANRLVSIKDWANRITRYAYDGNGKLTNILFPNGTSRKMIYDIAGQITFRQDRDAQGQIIVTYRYSYDASGQVTVEAAETASPPYVPDPVSMSYDLDNRLLTFNNQSVVFDKDGNMTAGPLGASSSNFSYDFNNNLIQAGNVSYAYDLEDRLIAFAVSGAATSLVNNPGGGVSQILQKRAPNGVVTNYVWGVGLAYEETGGQIRVYHYDQRGSTVAFTGNTGTVTGRVNYGPFGEIADRSGNTDSLFLYGGLFGVVTDPQNLYYMRFRWYSPQIKRFLNQDAHFGNINVSGTLNRFAYVANNPILRTDPKGECWPCLGAVVGAAVSVAIKAVGDYADDGKINDPWEEYAGAAIGGAVQGFIITACPTCSALAGGAGAAAQYLATQGFKGERVDPVDLAVDTALGAALGKALGSGGKGLTRPKNFRFATNSVGTLVKRQLAHQLKEAARGLVEHEVLSAIDEELGVREAVKHGAHVATHEIGANIARLVAGTGSDEADVTGRPIISQTGRQEVNRGRKGIYGEYIHYQAWLDALRLAARPIPNNPNHLLTSF